MFNNYGKFPDKFVQQYKMSASTLDKLLHLARVKLIEQKPNMKRFIQKPFGAYVSRQQITHLFKDN